MSDRAAEPQRTEQVAHCYRHPNREAMIRCTRCDRPICPECMRPASVGFQCPDDARAGARSVRQPRNAVGARLLQSPPYVTIVLVVLNVVAYLVTGLQSLNGLSAPDASSRLFLDWQLFPGSIHDGAYYQLLTSAFLHATPLHIGANMLALIVIGPVVEQLLGRWRFTALYLLSALGGGAAVYAFGSPFATTVGASGAIFGLFGAALVLVRKLGLDLPWLVGIVVLNFVLTFSVAGISKLDHIGGIVIGALAALVIGGLPQSSRRVESRRQVTGLIGLFVLVAVVAGVRSLTW